jgi:PIN domain nuclease of toxin-antitoxin system
VSRQLLADTNVVVWILEASTRVPPRARRELFDSANALVVSVVSVWEIILKHQARKLVLSANLGATLDQIVHNSPWALLPVRPEIHRYDVATLW